MQWLNSPEQDAKWVTKAGSLPLRKGTAEQPEWIKYQKDVPGLSVFLDGLDGARVKPANPSYPKVSEAVGQSLVAVLLKRSSPEDALNSAVQAQRGRSCRRRLSAWPRRRACAAGLRRHADGLAVRRPGRRDHPRAEPRADGLGAAAELSEADLVTPSTWVGIDNYKRLADDPTFRGAVQHTLLYTAAFVPLSIGGGLGLALLLNRRIRFIGLYRTLVFVPYIISATAQGVLFSFMFDAQFGVANAVLDKVGIAPQGFLADPGRRCGCSSRSGSGAASASASSSSSPRCRTSRASWSRRRRSTARGAGACSATWCSRRCVR